MKESIFDFQNTDSQEQGYLFFIKTARKTKLFKLQNNKRLNFLGGQKKGKHSNLISNFANSSKNQPFFIDLIFSLQPEKKPVKRISAAPLKLLTNASPIQQTRKQSTFLNNIEIMWQANKRAPHRLIMSQNWFVSNWPDLPRGLLSTRQFDFDPSTSTRKTHICFDVWLVVVALPVRRSYSTGAASRNCECPVYSAADNYPRSIPPQLGPTSLPRGCNLRRPAWLSASRSPRQPSKSTVTIRTSIIPRHTMQDAHIAGTFRASWWKPAPRDPRETPALFFALFQPFTQPVQLFIQLNFTFWKKMLRMTLDSYWWMNFIEGSRSTGRMIRLDEIPAGVTIIVCVANAKLIQVIIALK